MVTTVYVSRYAFTPESNRCRRPADATVSLAFVIHVHWNSAFGPVAIPGLDRKG
jgi:hypothetical protein